MALKKKIGVQGGVVLLLLPFLLLGCRGPERPTLFPEIAEALVLKERAAEYLWSQQGADGGWHSSTHGLLKGGDAYTPYILFHLLEASPAAVQKRRQPVAQALTFIRQRINEAGALGFSDPLILEYPNYATAYGLRVLAQYGATEDAQPVASMRAYLRDQQFGMRRGLNGDDPEFGGWGFGEAELPHGQAGHVDLSHTRRILQALDQTAGLYEEDAARAFLLHLQNRQLIDSPHAAYYDGGFHYAPVFLANKGAVTPLDDQTVFHSYATATCDGLLALNAMGVSREDPAVQDGLAWLARNDSLAFPQGIPPNTPASWDRVMFFYHLAVRAEVYARYSWPPGKRQAMYALLAEHVRPDGSYLNPLGAPNKENDPLLATTMALIALHYLTTEA